MPALPEDRVEFILMSDQTSPLHLWIQSKPEWARVFKYDRDKSLRIVGAAVLLLLLFILLLPAATVLLALFVAMVLFPLYVVHMIGFFRS